MAKGHRMNDLDRSKNRLKMIESLATSKVTLKQFDPFTSLVEDLASEEKKRELITPITEEQKKYKCVCGHLKKYHIIDAASMLVCKYESCKNKCKGFKLSRKSEQALEASVEIENGI